MAFLLEGAAIEVWSHRAKAAVLQEMWMPLGIHYTEHVNVC